jgi:hypothetical protein
VHVWVFWHLHSKKDCTLQVLHALCLDPISKSTFSFQQNAFDDFRSRTPVCRPICDHMYHWATEAIHTSWKLRTIYDRHVIQVIHADTYTYIHIQYCICVYVPVSCIYHVVCVCMILYVHVYACMWMYVYVCVFWHLHSKKDCTLQVLHAQRLALDSKSMFSFQQNACDVSRSRTHASRCICDCMCH